MKKYVLPTGTDSFSADIAPEEEMGFTPKLSEFQILDDIAQGGMGIVYKVFDRKEQKISALKVLNILSLMPRERNEEIARFQREGRLALSLDHPSMVQAYRMGCEGGIWYYAMEYVAGEDLGEIVDREGKISEKRALDVTLVVAQVLQYIEERGMVHRDIKPDNILMGYDGSLKLCDYGLMRQRVFSTAITSPGISIGTPNYMSPEQAKGDEDLDIRSDIYSLGMTLFHLLVGKTPFESTSVTLTLSRHIFERVPSIRRFDKSLSTELEQIIFKMTHKKPENRYKNAAELVAALKDYIQRHHSENSGEQGPPSEKREQKHTPSFLYKAPETENFLFPFSSLFEKIVPHWLRLPFWGLSPPGEGPQPLLPSVHKIQLSNSLPVRLSAL